MSRARQLAAALVLTSATCAGAQVLPPTAATAPTAPPAPAAPPAGQSPSQQPPRRALVTFSAGRLSVQADNSSLNQILREIARLTGMKITGGVVDERVFGLYGPAETGVILTALLDGTGSNMILISDARQSPQELVLTPRQGGPTPPNPNATRERDEQADLPPQPGPRFPGQPNGAPPQQQQSANPQPNPFNRPRNDPGANPTDLSTTNAAATSTATDTTTTDQSPNGVKTPEQIYQQLLKLQQQQQKTPQDH